MHSDSQLLAPCPLLFTEDGLARDRLVVGGLVSSDESQAVVPALDSRLLALDFLIRSPGSFSTRNAILCGSRLAD